MSTLQVANLHFESTGNNRIQYTGSNSYNIVAGGTTVITANSTVATGQFGPKLLQTVTVSSIASDNLTFDSVSSYNYSTYYIVFSGVSSNSVSDTKWRIWFSGDNGSSYTTIGTNITGNARTDRYLDGVITLTVPQLTSNTILVKAAGYTAISGSATATTDVSDNATIYGANTLTNIRLASQDAGRGFGTQGTIYLYGAEVF